MGEPRELQQQSVPPRSDAQLRPQYEGPSTEAGYGAEALQSLELQGSSTTAAQSAYSGKREGGYQDEPWHLSMGVLGPGLHARFDAQMDIEADVIPSIVDAFNTWSRSTSKLRPTLTKRTRDDLEQALQELGLKTHVDSVNPDIKPGPGQ